MATAFLGTEQHDVAGAPASSPAPELRLIVSQLCGAVMLTAGAYIALAMVAGLSAATRIINDYEALHGPLQIEGGIWAHGTNPASFELCNQIDAAAGWLYPFGALVWFPVLALFWFGSAFSFERMRTVGIVLPVLTISVVAAALYFGGTTGAVVAILE